MLICTYARRGACVCVCVRACPMGQVVIPRITVEAVRAHSTPDLDVAYALKVPNKAGRPKKRQRVHNAMDRMKSQAKRRKTRGNNEAKERRRRGAAQCEVCSGPHATAKCPRVRTKATKPCASVKSRSHSGKRKRAQGRRGKNRVAVTSASAPIVVRSSGSSSDEGHVDSPGEYWH